MFIVEVDYYWLVMPAMGIGRKVQICELYICFVNKNQLNLKFYAYSAWSKNWLSSYLRRYASLFSSSFESGTVKYARVFSNMLTTLKESHAVDLLLLSSNSLMIYGLLLHIIVTDLRWKYNNYSVSGLKYKEQNTQHWGHHCDLSPEEEVFPLLDDLGCPQWKRVLPCYIEHH